MWRLKHFLPKDQASLEGKSVEVGPLKLQVRSTIAQGGFSSVYLARDAQSGKTYALKHIICNDQELLDLVKKEVSIMKMLKGHPNVVTLHAQAVFDMGRTKECFLVMENCDKTLVNVLDNRGAGYFDEKQLLLMFRDICNAVYAMHCQSPPVAHRDLKAENVLLGPDGLWKLCDFGSTSTNHKCFERADEMGVEEDNIRKHTTPAYRAPEMWDLYQREVLSEKVDIWALGCLLFRMAYLKFAFDGESKLQILNGNYRIPDAPRYSSSVTNLIKDMLSTSPGTRPDILQVWHRVNESLPNDCRKACPDKPPTTAIQQSETTDSRITGPTKTSPVAPSRSPPPPPPSGSKETERRPVQTSNTSGSIGSFWSTQYAQEVADNSTKRNGASSPSKTRPKSPVKLSPNSSKEHASAPSGLMKKSGMGSLVKKVQGSVGQKGKDDNLEDGYKIMTETGNEHGSASKSYPSTTTASSISELKGQTVYSSNTASPVSEVKGPSTDGAFNAFVAEFDGMVHGSGSGMLRTNEQLMADIDRLNAELKQVVVEKVEISGKYEKLTAICRSQRQEIQDLKSALAAASSQANTKDAAARSVRTTPSNSRDKAENWQNFDQTIEKRNGTIWDLQDNSSPNQSRAASEQRDPRSWQAFNEFSGRPLQQPNDNQAGLKGSPVGDHADARRRQHTRAASISGNDTWNFVQDSFAAANNTFHDPKATDYKSSARLTAGLNGGLGSTSFRATGSPKEIDPRKSVKRSQQPAGWAGF